MGLLSIGSQNIQGGIGTKVKSFQNNLYKEICKNDVYCIQESWVSENQENDNQVGDSPIPKVRGYEHFSNLRSKGKKTRVFGGNVVYFRSEFKNKYIRKLGSKYNDFLWMWLDGEFFNLPADLYLCSVYIPHEKSVVHETRKLDPFQILAEETAQYQQKGLVMHIGDFNSRTGSLPEDWNFLANPALVPGQNNFSVDTETSTIPKRRNEDTESNTFGKKLLKLCETLGLVILNGRKSGDFFGKKTFHGHGSSTIDYAVCSLAMYRYIQSFHVHSLDWFSDHCQISLKFNTSYLVDWVNTDELDNATETTPHSKYMWDENSKILFRNIFTDNSSQAEIDRISQNLEQTDVNTACSDITNMFHMVADKSCKTKTLSSSKQQGEIKEDKFIPEKFRKNLKWAKHNFKLAKDSYRDKTGDQNRRFTMIKCRKSLKNLIYLIERYKKEDKINKIASLEKKNPKQFWSNIKLLTKSKTNKANISPSKWFLYFKGLLNVNASLMDQNFLQYVRHALPVLEKNCHIDQELNKAISLQEVTKVIRALKNGKAAGPDRILNEMIKLACPSAHLLLTRFYNHILAGGVYPNAWKCSVISTIFKSGDVDLPTNYRGVAVSSALHKVFTKILNKRIVNYMTTSDKWSKFQNGFMEKKTNGR